MEYLSPHGVFLPLSTVRLQEEGLIKGTSRPSHCPMSGASEALPRVTWECSIGATRSRCPGWEGVPTCVREGGHMPPPLGSSYGGLPNRVDYLSPHGVLLPLSTVRPLHPVA